MFLRYCVAVGTGISSSAKVPSGKDIKVNPVPGIKEHPRKSSGCQSGAELKLGQYQLKQNLRKEAADNSAKVGVEGVSSQFRRWRMRIMLFCESLASHVIRRIILVYAPLRHA